MKKKLVISSALISLMVSGCSSFDSFIDTHGIDITGSSTGIGNGSSTQMTKLEIGASNVLVSKNKPKNGCKYLGHVVGHQDSAPSTSMDMMDDLSVISPLSKTQMEEGAMNDLKNQANKLGANYVQILLSRAPKSSALIIITEQTGATLSGSAFKCAEM